MPLSPAAIEVAAQRLAAARRNAGPIVALPGGCRPRTESEAYDVQRSVHRELTAAGWGETVGHKIGCTTAVMRRMLGIASPCAGAVFAGTLHQDVAVLRHADFRRPGVECEIAVFLGADLPIAQQPYTRNRVSKHVAACAAAIEVVDDRYADYRALGAPLLIADDFFNAGCVIGPCRTDWREIDLARAAGRTVINGTVVGSGVGADVMGHPFEAVAWLANQCAKRGESLRKGSFVLTGSVVETRWVAAGDSVAISIDGLGEARVTFV